MAGVPGDTHGGARAAAASAASVRRVIAAACVSVSLPVLPEDRAVIASCPKPPVLPRARYSGAYPSRKVDSQGSPSSILSQRAARFGKGTSSLESHCFANQIEHRIWTQRMMNAGTWGLWWRSWGTYSSNSCSHRPISCPNVFNFMEDVCLSLNRVWPGICSLLCCPQDCLCEVGIVTPSEATSFSASARLSALWPPAIRLWQSPVGP